MAIVVIGSLWLAAASASAQSPSAQSPSAQSQYVSATGTPYMPAGYVAPLTTEATFVAPTIPTYAPRTTSIRGLWIPGLIGLPIAYVATWVNASLSFAAGSDGVNAAFIPLAGPWLVLAAQNADVGYYVTTGIVQDLSFLCLILGLVIRVPEPALRVAVGESTLRLAATPTASGGAFSASLRF